MGSDNPYLSAEGRDWARNQLIEAGHEPGSVVSALVNKILNEIDSVMDAYPESPDVLPIVAKLVIGKHLGEDEWSDAKRAEGYVWRPIMPRSLNPGDVVRVRQDAYTEPDKAFHNGKQGTVSGIRHGYVYVLYSATPGLGMGVPHKPDSLEVRLQVRPTPTT